MTLSLAEARKVVDAMEARARKDVGLDWQHAKGLAIIWSPATLEFWYRINGVFSTKIEAVAHMMKGE